MAAAKGKTKGRKPKPVPATATAPAEPSAPSRGRRAAWIAGAIVAAAAAVAALSRSELPAAWDRALGVKLFSPAVEAVGRTIGAPPAGPEGGGPGAEDDARLEEILREVDAAKRGAGGKRTE